MCICKNGSLSAPVSMSRLLLKNMNNAQKRRLKNDCVRGKTAVALETDTRRSLRGGEGVRLGGVRAGARGLVYTCTCMCIWYPNQ